MSICQAWHLTRLRAFQHRVKPAGLSSTRCLRALRCRSCGSAGLDTPLMPPEMLSVVAADHPHVLQPHPFYVQKQPAEGLVTHHVPPHLEMLGLLGAWRLSKFSWALTECCFDISPAPSQRLD